MKDQGYVEIPSTIHLSGQFAPETADPEARTIEVIWSTGQRVERYDYWNDERWYLQLSLDPAHVDLHRLNHGAPVLDSHARYSIKNQIGVSLKASVDGRLGRATLMFSKRPDVEPYWQDILAGVIRNISPGVAIRKLEDISESDDKIPTRLAVQYEVVELSFLPVQADAGAQVLASADRQVQRVRCEIVKPNGAEHAHKENAMQKGEETVRGGSGAPEDATHQAGGAEALGLEAGDVTAAGVAGRAAVVPTGTELGDDERRVLRVEGERTERKRQREIRAAGAALGIDARVVDHAIEQGLAIEQVREQFINLKAQQGNQVSITSHVTMGGMNEVDTFRSAVELAVLNRADHARYPLTEPARRFMGLSLLEIARECLEMRGIPHRGVSRVRVAELAFHTSSDFPAILANVVNRSLRAAYEAQASEWKKFCRQQNATDFKDQMRVQLGDAPALKKVNEHGEFTRGTVSEGKETYRIATYGRVLGLSRQSVINDDLGAFTRIPGLFGISAANLEADTVYGILIANPVMADGSAIFHATHGNLAGSGAAISDMTLGAALAAMRKQKSLDGQYINVVPKWLIVQPDHEGVAKKYTTQLGPTVVVAGKASDVNAFNVPGMVPGLEVIVEPRLVATTTAWYLSADAAQIDTVEYAYLEGQEGVYTETRMGFDVDGMEIKARLDFGAKALDFRGLYKNPGA
jgi:hypothetical protein